jgi:hypothetical protein
MSNRSALLNNAPIGRCNHNPACECEAAPGPVPLGPVYQTRRNYWIALSDVVLHDGRARWFVILGYTRKNIVIRELCRKPWGGVATGYVIPDPEHPLPGAPCLVVRALEPIGLKVWRGGRVKAPSDSVLTLATAESLQEVAA